MSTYDDEFGYFDEDEEAFFWPDEYEEDDFFVGEYQDAGGSWAGAGLAADPRQRMMLILFVVLSLVVLLTALKPGQGDAEIVFAAGGAANEAAGEPDAQEPAASFSGSISPVFSPEVQHWAPQIIRWATEAGVDPNMAATIMQIESCGDPQAVSRAGAQGLFQVMPFHFAAGENSLDPDTNARRGLNYFRDRLQQTNGDVGKAFAGYNGGHVAAGGSWNSWANETQRYFVWSTGIFEDASAGLAESPTLQEWLTAGGASLCRQAAQRLGL